jgi:carbonic anhydrase
MTFVETMLQRNAHFAATGFDAALKITPSAGTLILGCVDPRVDPAQIFGLAAGEAAVIRNVGGRVNQPLLETLGLLQAVTKAAGNPRAVTHLVLLHHTDCGIISCQQHAPDLLARHMGVATTDLDQLGIADPFKSVAMDIAALRSQPQLPDSLILTGLVYDVGSGHVQVAVPSAPVRQQA